MTLEFRQQSFSFVDVSGENPARRDEANIFFPGPVRIVNAALQDIDVLYRSADHHLQRLRVHASAIKMSGEPRGVIVRVDVQLRDKNGDDRFDADVTVLVIADLD
ncbi:hypothetical protein [Streptomyces sp. NPDC059862]|uniref:hypothetical protein n=1 Tax=unclassified Streptomyces TaxID=2593676 RepID=UPI00362F04EF